MPPPNLPKGNRTGKRIDVGAGGVEICLPPSPKAYKPTNNDDSRGRRVASNHRVGHRQASNDANTTARRLGRNTVGHHADR